MMRDAWSGPEPMTMTRSPWMALLVLAAVTFVAFITLDPDPNYLLAVSAAANVVLISWCMHRLYAWRMLLSPAASVVVGPGMIVYYTWGNLTARIAGEFRFAGNALSLEAYPLASLLATIGLALFAVLAFRALGRAHRYRAVTYESLEWAPWQAPAATAAGMVLLAYLSTKYEFRGGYFREVVGDLDLWLAASQYFFLSLGALIGVSVSIRRDDVVGKLLGLSAVVAPLVIAVGLRSRTFMIALLITIMSGALTLRPRWVTSLSVLGIAIAVVLLSAGTIVKAANVGGITESILDNLVAARDATPTMVIEEGLSSDNPDLEYRTAGLEFPAALIQLSESGVPPMYGQGIVQGALSGLPRFVRGEAEFSERRAIAMHYLHRGLLYDDSIGVPLTSGIADWGVVAGPLIYVVIALYCVVVWRFVQAGPRLFVAYLMAGASVGDLFWENAFFSVRAIAFAWLMLLVTGPLLMPRVRREASEEARHAGMAPTPGMSRA
jgi:hypothetical protein